MTDASSVTLDEYRQWYQHYGSMVGPRITDCSLEQEMNKVILRYQKVAALLHNEVNLEDTFKTAEVCSSKEKIQR